MKTLVVVRHGTYSNGHLDSYGQGQMRNIGLSLKEVVNGSKPLILASTAPRAAESAEIIGELLGVTPEPHELLWSDDEHPQNFSGTLNLIKSKIGESECIILVTHLEYASWFPSYFGQKYLEVNFSDKEIGKGQAWIINCETKERKLISG